MNKKTKNYFHPKYLKKHLEDLIIQRKIKQEKIGNKLKYCLVDFDFEKEFKAYTSELNKINKKFSKIDLDENEKISLTVLFLKKALDRYHELNIGWLYAECYSLDQNQINIIELSKKKLLNSMRQKLNELDEDDRVNIINYLR
jgi:hypothetical protein